MRVSDRFSPSLSPASCADLPGDVATGAAIVASNRRAVFHSGRAWAAVALPLALAACGAASYGAAVCDRRAPPWATAECRTVAR